MTTPPTFEQWLRVRGKRIDGMTDAERLFHWHVFVAEHPECESGPAPLKTPAATQLKGAAR